MIKRIIAGILLASIVATATTLTPVPHRPIVVDGSTFNGTIWVQK